MVKGVLFTSTVRMTAMHEQSVPSNYVVTKVLFKK